MTDSKDMKPDALRSLFRKRTSTTSTAIQNDRRRGSTSSPRSPSNVINLDQDVLIMIFDLIQSTSPKTLPALSLVNRPFYNLACHTRARDLQLNLSPSKLQVSHDRLKRIERRDLLSAIFTIDVIDEGSRAFDSPARHDPFAPSAVNYRNMLQSIALLMPLMTGLKTLSWNYSQYGEHIPDCVLQALRDCPKVQLRARTHGVPTYYTLDAGPNPNESNLIKLQGCANLSYFKVNCVYTNGEECLATTKPLKQLLLSAPALRSLSLNIGMPTSGCCMYEPPRRYCGLGFVGEEKMPLLEELVLSDYPWGHEIRDTGGQPWMNMYGQGYPGKGDEIDHWAENFDWSSLKRLETRHIDFALRIMPKLTSLKEVVLKNAWPQEDVLRFYQECPTALETIGVNTLKEITLEGITRHGSKLRNLRIHSTEGESWVGNAMDDVSLRTIRNSCPHIEELFLDIPRSGGEWPWSTLDILASFPNLRDLKICFELGISRDSDPTKPYVTFSSVRILYNYILKQNAKYRTTSTCKLTRFHVMSGAPCPMGIGLPAHDAHWPDENSIEFVCTLSDRDDEIARGVFEIICPGRWMEDIKEDDKGGKKKSASSNANSSPWGRRPPTSEAIRLATKGPIPRRKWESIF